MNNIIFVGKIVEDPTLKTTSQGVPIMHLQVEVDRPIRSVEGPSSDVFSAVLWRSLAENCAANCRKGQTVGIKGRLQSHSFSKSDGQTFLNYEIVAEKLSIVS